MLPDGLCPHQSIMQEHEHAHRDYLAAQGHLRLYGSTDQGSAVTICKDCPYTDWGEQEAVLEDVDKL